MKVSLRRTIALAAVTVVVLGVMAVRAVAWQTPQLNVTAAGCELADVSVSTTEHNAHVVASNVFPVGAVLPPNAALAVQIAGTGTIHISVTLDFPDHATAETDFTFTACPRDTTTTTAPSSTTTEPTVVLGPPETMYASASSENTGVTPHFTG